MSDNGSEVDQITGQLTGLAHKVSHVINTWRVMNSTATTVPRSVRRDINRLINTDTREREFAHAQERARLERAVIEYRWKLSHDREIRSWDTPDTWFERQNLLAQHREQVNNSVYSAAYLTATERGQATRALTGIHRNPYTPVGRVFGTRHGLDALRARVHDGITRLRAGLAGPTEQRRLQQWQQLHRERAEQATHRMQRPDWLLTNNPGQPTIAPQTTSLGELNRRINRYSELRAERGPYGDQTPAQMAAYDRDTAAYRDRIHADAHRLGADHAELVATALHNADLAYPTHHIRPTVERAHGGVDQNRDTTPARAGQGAVEPDRGYEVILGTAEFVREHPDMAGRIEVTTLTDGCMWALDQLADDSKGWPADADLVVHIHRPGQEAPIYQAAGPRGMVIDEVAGWHAEHEQAPLAEIEQLRTELHAARAENEQLRTENTELVRRFADHDLTQSPTAAAAPKRPSGPRLAQPIFAGPVISQPVLNGLDR